jgi:hypothetical protein
VEQAGHDRWLVAAGVVVMLVALVVVGRLQAGNLPKGDAGGPQPTKSTVRTDATPVASGLAVTGRVVHGWGPRRPRSCTWSPPGSR